MTNRNHPAAETLCPVDRAETVVGDRWTVLMLRELFMGNRRFEEFQAYTEATPQMVAARLKKLEADGLVKRRVYNRRPLRREYHLTEKGEAFFPVVLALRAWGETWCKSPKEGRAVSYTHRICGKPARARSCLRVLRQAAASRGPSRRANSQIPKRARRAVGGV
jgi:DNA-binding HxlR family transcriptional regulator